MFDEFFWREFWPQFFGGIASGIVLALLTLLVGYLTRIKLARGIKRVLERLDSTDAKDAR